MITFLRKKFIKNYENVNDTNVRASHGKLAAFFGIFSNLFLFCIKITVGILTANVSVFADSINNLSDMASCVIILIGFHYSKMPADQEHPFGHERVEYIAGLIVSILIIASGIGMTYSSISSIINYEAKELNVKITIISLCLLFISILVKLYQSHVNRHIAKLIKSDALRATAQDSLNDSISTTLVFIVLLVSLMIQLNGSTLSFSLDGILGTMISIYVILSGGFILKDEINHLIGYKNEYEKQDEIIEYIKSNDKVLGVHDCICHTYGPTKIFMTAHIEIDSKTSIVESHDIADTIEHYVKNQYNVDLTIHVDPVDLDNNELIEIRKVFDSLLPEDITYHDLRIAKCNNEYVIEADIAVNFKEEFDIESFKENAKNKLKEININYDIDLSLDRK